MAETLESIKQEIAKIAAEKADLKGIVDQQKETIQRQETTIGNLQEALKALDVTLDKEIADNKELKEALTDWKRIAEERKEKSIQIHNARVKEEKQVHELKEALDREATENVKLIKEVGTLTELKEELKTELEQYKEALAAKDREIDVLVGEVENLETEVDETGPGMVAALAAKDEELRKLGEKVPAKDREINDLKEQVKSLEKALDRKGDESYKLSLEKEHLANAIENAYRSLMITRGYQLPDESGVSNG